MYNTKQLTLYSKTPKLSSMGYELERAMTYQDRYLNTTWLSAAFFACRFGLDRKWALLRGYLSSQDLPT